MVLRCGGCCRVMASAWTVAPADLDRVNTGTDRGTASIDSPSVPLAPKDNMGCFSPGAWPIGFHPIGPRARSG